VTVSATRHHSPALPGTRPRRPRRRPHPAGLRGVRLLGRTIAVIVILVWSLFPLYWALNTSLTTLNGAESRPAHLVPSPFNISSYQQLFGVTGS
jgi:ABC-type glycerol-3-phosphate transport system permease component